MSVIEKIKQNGTLSRIKNHNLVCRTPIDDPTRGIPLGNGSTGLLVWPEKDRLVFTVNHTDLWDLADGDEIRNWNPEDEEYKCAASGGETGIPLFRSGSGCSLSKGL